MNKFERIAGIIRNQIEKGDFSLSDLPSERVLAEKLGVNRLTVRKAQSLLDQEGWIHRAENGRYVITANAGDVSKNMRIALLAPPEFSSGNIRIWYNELLVCANKNRAMFRPFLFVHWNDISISDVFSNFNGVFIIPPEETAPENMLGQFESKKGLVFLNTNLSHHHILSVNLFPAIFVRQLLDRLQHVGHHSIACIHLQSDISDVLNNRIGQWEYWSALNNNEAPLIKADVDPFDEGYDFLDKQIKKGALENVTAAFCTTVHAAIALIRGCKNNGIDPEKEISICTVDDEGIGMHATPSITCFRQPDIQKILQSIFNWIQGGGDVHAWKGPLLIEPSSLDIYEGETFHPPAKDTRQSQ